MLRVFLTCAFAVVADSVKCTVFADAAINVALNAVTVNADAVNVDAACVVLVLMLAVVVRV